MKTFSNALHAARATIEGRRALLTGLLGSAAALVTGVLAPRSARAGGECGCCFPHPACKDCWDVNWDPNPQRCYCAATNICKDCLVSEMMCWCEHVLDIGPTPCEEELIPTCPGHCTSPNYVCTNLTFYAPCP